MKSNNLICALTILTVVSLILTLNNSANIDEVANVIENIETAIRRRDMLPGDNNVLLLNDLITQVINSGLHPDSIRFIIDFIHIHLNNLPTEEEISNLIEVLKELETKLNNKETGFSNIADYLSKHGKGPGPGPAGGSSAATVIPK